MNLTRKEAVSYIKEQLPNYLESKDINLRNNFTCLTGTHEDKNPSMSYFSQGNKVKCFSCGYTGDTLDLIGLDYHLEGFNEQLEKACQLYGITLINEGSALDWNDPIGNKTAQQKQEEPKQGLDIVDVEEERKKYREEEERNRIDYSGYIEKCAKNISNSNYLTDRGISQEVLERFQIGYDENFQTYVNGIGSTTWKAVIIPTSQYSYVVRNTNKESKERIRASKGGRHIFNLEAIDKAIGTNTPIFIVEGEIDALSVETLGYRAIGLGGTANTNPLIEHLKSLKKNNQKTPPLIVALDNDEAGKRQADELTQKIRDIGGIEVYKTASLYGEKFKDANERLQGEASSFKQDLEEIAVTDDIGRYLGLKEYEKTNASNYINDFLNGISKSANTPSISTGFPLLDEALGGGLYEGLYVMGAISGLGKTTFIMQIADQLALQGKDVLIISLEMARTELMAKSISRLTAIKTLEEGGETESIKTARGITEGRRYQYYNEKERDLIKGAIMEYSNYANHLYIHEGVGNIGATEVKNLVEEHKRYTGNAPIVIIDYLQILAPYDIRATDKQNTDKAVIELKRMSRDYKTTVIGISSFNRQNYKERVSMASFKESGAIEYTSDVLLGLQFQILGDKDIKPNNIDLTEEYRKEPRTVQVSVLKNRNGQTGTNVSYDYYAKFNYFKETGF